jgi:hypothetical protein
MIKDCLPSGIIEQAVHDWVHEHRDDLSNFIINRLQGFVARVNADPSTMTYALAIERIERLEHDLKNVSYDAKGLCPECGRPVKDWKPPFGSFAPEAWATYREMGIDPTTGHKETCSRKHTGRG